MKNLVVSRHALYASAAAVFLAACTSTSEGPSRINAPGSVASGIGAAKAGVVEICLDPASTAGSTLNFDITAGTTEGGDVIAADQGLTQGVNPTCFDALTRFAGSASPLVASDITILASGAAGTITYTCVDDVAGTTEALCLSGASGGASGNAAASVPHGSTITFLFIAAPPPPPPPPPAAGCTFTQGWYKNKGAALAAAYDFDGGTNNGLTILNTPVKGSSYIELGHQYITASLNLAGGATMNATVTAAYNDATAYFAAASAGNPNPGIYTKVYVKNLVNILDDWNNGLSGTPHCDTPVV